MLLLENKPNHLFDALDELIIALVGWLKGQQDFRLTLQLSNSTKVQIALALLSLFLCLIVFIHHTVLPIFHSLRDKEIR